MMRKSLLEDGVDDLGEDEGSADKRRCSYRMEGKTLLQAQAGKGQE